MAKYEQFQAQLRNSVRRVIEAAVKGIESLDAKVFHDTSGMAELLAEYRSLHYCLECSGGEYLRLQDEGEAHRCTSASCSGCDERHYKWCGAVVPVMSGMGDFLLPEDIRPISPKKSVWLLWSEWKTVSDWRRDVREGIVNALDSVAREIERLPAPEFVAETNLPYYLDSLRQMATTIRRGNREMFLRVQNQGVNACCRQAGCGCDEYHYYTNGVIML